MTFGTEGAGSTVANRQPVPRPEKRPWKLAFQRADEELIETFTSLAAALIRAEALTKQENTTVLNIWSPTGQRITSEEIFASFKNSM